MWNYEKRLQYPVKITQTNPKIAQVIITQFGGPNSRNYVFAVLNRNFFCAFSYIAHDIIGS